MQNFELRNNKGPNLTQLTEVLILWLYEMQPPSIIICNHLGLQGHELH